MTDLLLWGGPVYAPHQNPISAGGDAGDVGAVVWQRPTDIITFQCEGSSSCGALAAGFRGSDGRILPAMLASRGLSVTSYDRIAIAGFSAFHGMANALLASDGDLIDAAVLLDACFSSVSPPWTKNGYVSFGQAAAAGQRLMVYCTSTGGGAGGAYPSSTAVECVQANYEAAGGSESSFDPGLPADVTPGAAYRTGNLVWLDYAPLGWRHDQIPHQLTRDVLSTLLAPYMAQGDLYGSSSQTVARKAVKAAALGLLAAGTFVAASAILGE